MLCNRSYLEVTESKEGKKKIARIRLKMCVVFFGCTNNHFLVSSGFALCYSKYCMRIVCSVSALGDLQDAKESSQLLGIIDGRFWRIGLTCS